MARGYPRFLLSMPKGGKNTGPFVFHTLTPNILCRIVPTQEDKSILKNQFMSRNGWCIELLKCYDETPAVSAEIDIAMDAMLKWLPSQFLNR